MRKEEKSETFFPLETNKKPAGKVLNVIKAAYFQYVCLETYQESFSRAEDRINDSLV